MAPSHPGKMECARGGGGLGGMYGMVLPLLCCAHNTMMCFCVARIWESRDHGTLYFFCLFALRAYGSPALMVPYNFCCAHGRLDVKEKEMRSGHVPYGVVLRSSINAFYTISGGFQKIKFWKSDSERQNVPARLANMVKGRRTATIYLSG